MNDQERQNAAEQLGRQLKTATDVMWKLNKETIAPGPNNVLADEAPYDEAPYDEAMAEKVSSQYRVVQNATGKLLREAVRFGALLMEVEATVGNARGRIGEGLKAWLAEHCPEVNYNTARAHKCTAGKAAALIGGTWIQAVTALKGEDAPGAVAVPAVVAERRRALFASFESRRQLEKAYHAYMAISLMDPPEELPLPKLTPAEEAEAIWTKVMGSLDKNAVRDAIPLLPEKSARVCLARLDELSRAVKAHLNQLRGER